MMGSRVSNQTILYLTGAVIVGIFLILFINVFSMFSFPTNEKYLSYNDVRGIAIEHNHLLYTLNFDQQNQLIDYINMTLPVGKEGWNLSQKTIPYDKIIIYRFNQHDAILTPIGIDNHNLVFSAPEIRSKGYLMDVTSGKLNKLLSSTYD